MLHQSFQMKHHRLEAGGLTPPPITMQGYWRPIPGVYNYIPRMYNYNTEYEN
jgi:hypothetical protein